MVKLGYLFSGQGKQFPHMGQDLYEQEPKYRQTIDEASEVLKLDLANSEVFDAPQNVQVAILTMSLGIFRLLSDEFPAPVGMIGLSLGEYSALIASQALSFPAGLSLVYDRARYMDQAAERHPGTMAAVLKAPASLVEAACQKAAAIGPVYPANYNTPDQVVIGGSLAAVKAASADLKAHGIKRVVRLKVRMASHTPFMQLASDLLAQRMTKVVVNRPKIPVFSNTTTNLFSQEKIKSILTQQLVKPTHFGDCLQQLATGGLDRLVEIGPGETLTHFAGKTLGRQLPAYHIDNVETLNQVRKYLEMAVN